MEHYMRSLALTAARQICGGSEHDAEDAMTKLQCAKAQLPSAQQFKPTREHFDNIEDDVQTTTDRREAAAKQLQ